LNGTAAALRGLPQLCHFLLFCAEEETEQDVFSGEHPSKPIWIND